MSEDQPKQPESAQPQEQAAPTPATAQPGRKSANSTQTRVQVQPVLKVQTVKILRATIGLLEGVVAKLEAAPSPQQSPAQPSFFQLLQDFWASILRIIRGLLPQSVNQKLPDWGLTGAIATAAILIFLVITNIGQSKPTEVATQPPGVEAPPPAVVSTPSEETPPPAVVSTPPEAATPSPAINTPPELEAPRPPKPVEFAPPPPPVLTPEQSLIASIQKQVADITTGYPEGLIQSIQANFPGSLLSVKVGDAWYNLNESQQDKLAAQMLQRSQELEFSKLEITDAHNQLVARNALVGNNMIILQRRLLTASS